MEMTLVRKRWLPVGLLALGIFVVNGIARLVTWKGEFVTESEQMTIGFVAVTAVAVLLIGVSAWWAIRQPFARLLGDVAAAVGVGALLSLLIGPFLGGARPFAEGLGNFVGQVLLFLGVAAVGVFLGFAAVVALGQDWRSRSLRQYEQSYRAKPGRIVRG
jgi:hypothetical protein